MGLLDTHWLEKKYINYTNSYSLKKLAEQKEIFMEQNTKQFISFKGSILNGFKKTFDFTGLATRSEFWFWILFGLILIAISILVETYLGWLLVSEIIPIIFSLNSL